MNCDWLVMHWASINGQLITDILKMWLGSTLLLIVASLLPHFIYTVNLHLTQIFHAWNPCLREHDCDSKKCDLKKLPRCVVGALNLPIRAVVCDRTGLPQSTDHACAHSLSFLCCSHVLMCCSRAHHCPQAWCDTLRGPSNTTVVTQNLNFSQILGIVLYNQVSYSLANMVSKMQIKLSSNSLEKIKDNIELKVR